MSIVYRDESYAVMGAWFEVYTRMGSGLLEAVYQECLELELDFRGIPFVPKANLELTDKGRVLKQRYVPDFLLYGKIVPEIKAASALADEHRARLFNDLKATGHRLGLLVNFGHHPQVQSERIVL